MYSPVHNNGYYASKFGNVGTVYARQAQLGKAAQGQSKVFDFTAGSNFYNKTAFGSDALKYVTNIKKAGSEIQASLKNLSSGAAFNKKGVVAENSDVASVKDAGYSFSSAKIPSKIDVEQVATAQVNEGESLKSDANAGLSGRSQFSISVNGKKADINVYATSTDSNLDVQEKMAFAINAKGLGVKASVVKDEKEGTSFLKIENTQTGETKGAFSVENRSGEGFEKMGLGNVKTQSADAKYSIDGGESKTSASNQINLAVGVTATLKGAGSTGFKRDVDSSAAISMAEDLAASYNDLYGAALNNTDDVRSNMLFTQIVNNSRTYASSLGKIGISFDKDGFMEIDKEKMQKAADDGSLKSFFTESAGKNYGFTSNLNKIASNVQTNTNRYVSPSSFTSGNDIQSYAKAAMANNINYLASSLFGTGTMNSALGWMFDFSL